MVDRRAPESHGHTSPCDTLPDGGMGDMEREMADSMRQHLGRPVGAGNGLGKFQLYQVRRQAVLSTVLMNSRITNAQLAEVIGTCLRTAVRIVSTLVQEGYLHRAWDSKGRRILRVTHLPAHLVPAPAPLPVAQPKQE